MKVKAAVAWETGQPLSIETIDLEGPKAGEVLAGLRAVQNCQAMLKNINL